MNLQQRLELKMFTRAVRQMRKINTQIYNSKTKNGLSKIENRHQIAQNSMPIEAVIPPFVGLFETRITRPICTGSVS